MKCLSSLPRMNEQKPSFFSHKLPIPPAAFPEWEKVYAAQHRVHVCRLRM